MSPELTYFLKVNMAFALFYAFYRLFFYKDTFFKLRRSILLAFWGLAAIYPLFNLQDWIKAQEPIAEVILYYSLIITPAIEPEMGTASINWVDILYGGLWLIYLGGIAFLFVRFFSQLGSILWLARKSKKISLHDTSVYALEKPAGPFSFFRLIFIHPKSHSEEETEEILTHELTHVRQWHSLDVIISEIVCMICWFNPFVWLLKWEVRHNLEYLADDTVLESGYDSRSYQYHLLGLAHHHKESTQIYNSFNVLHLKNRIGMMNKKRSRGIGRTKYLMFIPLVILLMIVSNIEAVARITRDMAQLAALPKMEALLMDEIRTVDTEEDDSDQVFKVVEEMPSFPGGDKALINYIRANTKYPESLRNESVEGRVIVSFVVDKKGSIRDIKTVKEVHPVLDAEAQRMVAGMPAWEPGKQKGQPVNTQYTVPVQFRKPVIEAVNESAENHTFTVVERMPQFPGGDVALLKHINSQIKYPVIAQEEGIHGRVVVSMVIDEKGDVADTEIVRGIHPSLDFEALRVVKTLPRWIPGEQRGKKVRVKYTLPIQFRLE